MIKLNKVLPDWPRGTVAVYPWLLPYGLSRKLLEQYKKSRRLLAFGHGALIRPDDRVDWQGALYTIQTQLKRNIHVGGKSALELLGYNYSLPMGRRTLDLFGALREKLPKWFRDHDWPVHIRFVNTNLFLEQEALGVEPYTKGDFSIQISSPERAILEVLYFAPRQASYEECKALLEGLATLRPGLIQELLSTCRSGKVKRLFMFLADLLRHPWKDKLDFSKIDIGRGNRILFKGGHLDPTYLITVPEQRA